MRIPDKTLLAISLSISCAGIIGLLLISTTTTINDTAAILTEPPGTTTTIHATITDLTRSGNITLLTLAGSCTVDAVAYQPLNTTTGTSIIATGTIDTYKGKRQLVLEEAKVYNP
ncbi:hypothetical protein GF367_01135 [Candidatus Woesearchaeota archaeon]|nr:hypothetical protein [Candidatus Woesearchaeota archaeon]